MQMNKIFYISIILISTIFNAQAQGKSWIAKDFPINRDLSDVEEAQRWALCAATIEVLAEVTRDQLKKPATADTLLTYSNGAKTAILGTFLVNASDRMKNKSDEEVQEIFKKTTEFAIMARTEFPALHKTRIMSDYELRDNKNSWYDDLGKSAASCLQKPALELQQIYIDAVRLLTSGVGAK